MSKRNQILLAALDMFGSQGFHDTKIKDIAIKADVGKGTVYEYFNSKSDLLLSSIYYALDLYLTSLDDISQMEVSVKEKFKAIVQMDLESSKYQMNLMHNVLIDTDNNACDLGERFIGFKIKRKEVLLEIFDSIVKTTDTDFIQMIISGTTSQYIMEKTLLQNPMTIDEYTEKVFDTLGKL